MTLTCFALVANTRFFTKVWPRAWVTPVRWLGVVALTDTERHTVATSSRARIPPTP